MFKFELGAKVRSTVHGFEGVITSRAENMHRIDSYVVNRGLNKDGDITDGQWLVEGELELVKPVVKKKVKA